MDSCSSDRARQQCALCWNKARIGNTCDACLDSMGLDPSDRAVLREPEAAVRDLELLELAALAGRLPWDKWVIDGDDSWSSLDDDGDALRLAVELGFSIITEPFFVRIHGINGALLVREEVVLDGFKATRRAITRAAAQIGSELRKTASGSHRSAGSDEQNQGGAQGKGET